MSIPKVPRVASGVAVLIAAALVSLLPRAGAAQGNPMVGTWTLNVAKSKYSPGPAPKSTTVTWEAAGQGLKLTSKGVDAEGKPTNVQYTVNFDGKDYPVTGSSDFDAVALKKVDASTMEATRKMGGKMVQTARYVLSKDGKTYTVTAKGTNAKGQQVNNVVVYDKK